MSHTAVATHTGEKALKEAVKLLGKHYQVAYRELETFYEIVVENHVRTYAVGIDIKDVQKANELEIYSSCCSKLERVGCLL
ncbi:hypothetical protein Q3A90_23240 [Priestia megaterium]|uniref:hypothetical protein n=1 Tax=Priestia megaterium TaxID=1404 RepID=UPI00267718C3|nr:hypothetical protein [Priestia megaterium]WKU22663.1 hypothetical protein Q3A90_23240 [Priestia megaterium]